MKLKTMYTFGVLMEHAPHPSIPIALPNGLRIGHRPKHEMTHYHRYVNMENALHVNSYALHLLTTIPAD